MALQRGKVLNEWNAVVNDRDKWKALIQNVCKCTTRNEKLTTENEDRNVTNGNCNSLYMLVTVIYIRNGIYIW